MSSKTHPANRRQPAQPRRKIHPVPTKTVSGIPYWPARDPIGENGGVNLYGFVGNDGVDRWDVLGKSEPASASKSDTDPCHSCGCLEFYLQERGAGTLDGPIHNSMVTGPPLKLPEIDGKLPRWNKVWHGSSVHRLMILSRWKNTPECSNCCKTCLDAPVEVQWKVLDEKFQERWKENGIEMHPLSTSQTLNGGGCDYQYVGKTWDSGVKEILTRHGNAEVPGMERFPDGTEVQLSIIYKDEVCTKRKFKLAMGDLSKLGNLD